MSGLTPDEARRAAEWLNNVGNNGSAKDLRAEAHRLEDAAKTPGQVMAESLGHTWRLMIPAAQRTYELSAAAVIDHVVGRNRVVVDRADLNWVLERFVVQSMQAHRLREALA